MRLRQHLIGFAKLLLRVILYGIGAASGAWLVAVIDRALAGWRPLSPE